MNIISNKTNKMIAHVFDVDGTLTPSRLSMDPKFKKYFLKWMKGKTVIFVTGSDKDKTIEQIGLDVWNEATACMQSCGNHIFVKGEEVSRNSWKADEGLISLLEQFLVISKYRKRTSNHIEHRIGLCNFSVIGRDCSQREREDYAEWDDFNKERLDMAQLINENFPELEASVGGQISIDIHPKGANKSQAKKWILENIGEDTVIRFYGDKTKKGVNDYDLANVFKLPHEVFQVKDWEHTYRILKDSKKRDKWLVDQYNRNRSSADQINNIDDIK